MRRALRLTACILQASVAVPFAYLGLIYGALAFDPPPCTFLCFGPGFFVASATVLLAIALGVAMLGAAAARGVRWARIVSLVACVALAALLVRVAQDPVDEGWQSVGVTASLMRAVAGLAALAALALVAAWPWRAAPRQ